MLKIQKTTDYSQFKFISDINRIPQPKYMIESILKKNMLETHPIICDKNLNVIDGQNRLRAAETLKLPIYFVVDEKIEASDISLCQVQNPWDAKDFLRFYKNSNENYAFIQEITTLYRLPIHFVIHCCSNSDKKVYNKFREGIFYISKDKDLLRRKFKELFEILNICKEFQDQLGKEAFKVKNNGYKALWMFINKSAYSHKKMLQKMKCCCDNFVSCFMWDKTSHILESLLNKVYNYKVQYKANKIALHEECENIHEDAI